MLCQFWILAPIDFCNKFVQASDATLDMEVANVESLLVQLVALRDSWKTAWNEAKLVASSLQIEVRLSRDRSTTARKRTRFHNEDTPHENVNGMNEAYEYPEEVHILCSNSVSLCDEVILRSQSTNLGK